MNLKNEKLLIIETGGSTSQISSYIVSVCGFTVDKFDFEWIDFVTLIPVKSDLKVKWIIFGDNNKESDF